jgi:hypothetical protein
MRRRTAAREAMEVQRVEMIIVSESTEVRKSQQKTDRWSDQARDQHQVERSLKRAQEAAEKKRLT